MQLLESSINILDTGVYDYPRLSKVLQTTRVSDLVTPPLKLTMLTKITPSTSN